MIKRFENYISQFENPDIDYMLEDVGLTREQFNQIVDKVADWYYDNYNITFLGAGAYGTAFRVNNVVDRVLKVTTDHNEAANISFLVKKSDTKGIVEYYDIHEIDVTVDGVGTLIVYSIIMEKLYDISDMERQVFQFMSGKYFKNGWRKNDAISFYGKIVKSEIGCTWKEFLAYNPNKVDYFVDANYEEDWYISKYDIEEVKELANIYYQDIMGMVWSVIKYDLEFHDVHMGNVRKTEDGHMKIIDVGGNCDVNKTFKSKSAPIKIDVSIAPDKEIVESVDLNTILPQKFNNLFYTRTDFIKMLTQILDFYYDEFGIKFLGHGAEGDTFKITSKDGTKVLKLTKSEIEALAIEKVRKYNIPRLVDYYDVRRIIDNEDIYFEIYAILMDNVELLNDMEKTVWTFLRGYFFNLKEFKDTTYLQVSGPDIDYKRFLEINSLERLNTTYKMYTKYRGQSNIGFGIAQIYYIHDDVNHNLMVTDKAYQTMLKFYKGFCELVKDAVKYKLKMKDFHTDNIGKDENGNLKFFDVLYDKKTKLKLNPIEINL